MTTGDEGADVEALQHVVKELSVENESLRTSEARDAERKRGKRWKQITSWVLLVLACLLAVVSVITVFGRNELLNTDTYVDTVAPLASDPAIQTAVAKQVSDNVIASTNVEQRVKNALPSKAGFLAVPITADVRRTTNQITLSVVQSAAFQKLWVEANRRSHKQLVAVLTGQSVGSFSTKNGNVTVDLGAVEVKVKKALDAKGITIFDKVPAAKELNFVLIQSDQLAKYQQMVRLLNKLVVVLPIVTLLCLAGSIALARNRRRGLLRAATGVALSMAVVLIGLAVVRNQYVSSLGPARSKDAATAVIDTVTAVLRATLRTVLIVAAVIAIGALVAGNAWVRGWVGDRRKPAWMIAGPFHSFVALHRRAVQWGILGLGLLVLVIWDTPTALVAVVVALITLAIVGLVGLFAGRRPVPAPSVGA